MPIVFCHGLESGPHGRKYHALADAGLDVLAPDFRGEDLAARVEHLGRVLAELDEPPVVVGSSFGGATAVLAADAAPAGAVRALVLCAPALALVDREIALAVPAAIIHGTRDDVCPIEHSRAFASRDGVELIEVDDDHRLADSLDRIVELVERYCAPSTRS